MPEAEVAYVRRTYALNPDMREDKLGKREIIAKLEWCWEHSFWCYVPTVSVVHLASSGAPAWGPRENLCAWCNEPLYRAHPQRVCNVRRDPANRNHHLVCAPRPNQAES